MIGHVQVPFDTTGWYGGYEDSSLSDYDVERISQHGRLLAYTYGNGGYEGSGTAIVEKDGRFGVVALGHCSCYGPGEDGPNAWHDTLDECEQPVLVAALRAAGYEEPMR